MYIALEFTPDNTRFLATFNDYDSAKAEIDQHARNTTGEDVWYAVIPVSGFVDCTAHD
jgi:hypothetical protein